MYPQISILLGVSQVFSNKLAKAEENLQIALEQLERQGLEMEVSGVPSNASRSISVGGIMDV